MAQSPNPSTLFHLVPLNDIAGEALRHPDNQRFVSPDFGGAGDLGLEVGFHVASAPGRVIARLGRNGDLILQRRNVSAVHVALELHPDTLVVLLSVRAKRMSSVTVKDANTPAAPDEEEPIEGDCVLCYGKKYEIAFVGYKFLLVWRATESEPLRTLAVQDYQRALQQQANVRSRDLPTETDSEIHTWHNTRIHTAQRILFREAGDVPRVEIGRGEFGAVYRAVDLESGHVFAIKVIHLKKYRNMEQARAVAHREVKALQRLSHKNIIEFLGCDKWASDKPEIFMPLRPGNLRPLAESTTKQWTDDQLSLLVLEQMLSALDHLACNSICHRDVKPENILYWESGDSVTFQLADFGLANHSSLARTECGTGYYKAPELYPEYGQFAQSPKMDVWSLFATIADINPRFVFPPTEATVYAEILQAVRAAAMVEPGLADMVRVNPIHRASAAQLLVAHFDGRGLSTPRAQVPPMTSNITPIAPAALAAQAAAPIPSPSLPALPALTIAPARRPAAFPLVKYPREPRRRPQQQDPGRAPMQISRPLEGRIMKPRAATTPGRTAQQRAAEKVPAAATERPADRPADRKERLVEPDRGVLGMPGSFPV